MDWYNDSNQQRRRLNVKRRKRGGKRCGKRGGRELEERWKRGGREVEERWEVRRKRGEKGAGLKINRI